MDGSSFIRSKQSSCRQSWTVKKVCVSRPRVSANSFLAPVDSPACTYWRARDKTCSNVVELSLSLVSADAIINYLAKTIPANGPSKPDRPGGNKLACIACCFVQVFEPRLQRRYRRYAYTTHTRRRRLEGRANDTDITAGGHWRVPRWPPALYVLNNFSFDANATALRRCYPVARIVGP